MMQNESNVLRVESVRLPVSHRAENDAEEDRLRKWQKKEAR